MKKIFEILVLITLLPFLYARYTFILTVPILIECDFRFDVILILWVWSTGLYGLALSFGLLRYLSKFVIRVLRIEWSISGYHFSDKMFSGSIWSHPILKVRGKEHRLSISIMGGNMYEKDDKLRRKAIFYHLTTLGK